MRFWKTVGSYGSSVQIFLHRGRCYLRYWDSARKDHTRRSLKHGNRARAEEQARELEKGLQLAARAQTEGGLPIGVLFARYDRDVSRHRTVRARDDDWRRMDLWEAMLGAEREVTTLSHPDLDQFVRVRKAGTLVVPWRRYEGVEPPAAEHTFAKRITDRTIGADIEFLRAVLNWATRVRRENARPLLPDNPIRGFALPTTANPRRPVATYDRYLKIRAVADRVHPLFGPFFDLIEALGWRVTAICELQAADVDLAMSRTAPCGRIRKRGEIDKEDVDMWVPLSAAARAAIVTALERNPTLGARPLFPAPRSKPEAPKAWSRYYARALLHRAEKLAEVPELNGSDFHAYRRKWVTERKRLPRTDVAAAGGWKTARTLEIYEQLDEETLFAVVAEPRKLREARAVGEAQIGLFGTEARQ